VEVSLNAIRITAFAAALLFISGSQLCAEPVTVRQPQGMNRGFLTMHAEDGKLLAHGDFIETVRGDRITTRLTFRFLDGSVDDDTAVFTQHGVFKLVSDHHIQKGPFFPKPTDILVDATSGNVTTHSVDKDGKDKLEVEHLDLQPDISNGIVGTLLLNVPHETAPFKLSMVVPSGKGRLVKLAIAPEDQATFYDTGLAHTATVFRIKIELGGVAGVVAPVVGKQPADTMVWVFEGAAPTLIRQLGQIYEGGPIVSIEQSGATFARHTAATH
jgi:hypothetical protein